MAPFEPDPLEPPQADKVRTRVNPVKTQKLLLVFICPHFRLELFVKSEVSVKKTIG